MADRIQLRRDLAANWTSANPILAQGEIGIETNTLKMKIGNGSTAWTSLAYYSTTPAETDPVVKAINGIVQSNGTTISAVVSGTNIKTVNSTSLLGSGDISIPSPVGKGIGIDYTNGAYLMQSGVATGIYIDGNSTQDQYINFQYSYANTPVVLVSFQNDTYYYVTFGVILSIYNISTTGFNVRMSNPEGFQFGGSLHWLAVPFSLPDHNY